MTGFGDIMIDPLFQPIQIGTLKSKNRICMPAMHVNMCDAFQVTDRMVDFYEARARGGAGIITVGYATVDDCSGSPFCLGAHEDAFIPGLTRLAAAIKTNGAKALVQLNHPGRYVRSSQIENRTPLAPSAIASRMTGETPKEMTREDIDSVIHGFRRAAVRVKTAGFDGLEVLSGTGYLISEFLSPVTNRRQDDFGGSLENRMRFGLKIIETIRDAVGDAFPVLVRINGNDFMPGGNGREELQAYAVALTKAGVDGLNINVGWHEARVPQITTAVPRGAFAYLARGIKERVGIPVMAGHRVHDVETARELVANEMCDMVAMGRALIADPCMPDKARQGREKEILHCIACNQGCFDRIRSGKFVKCLCNPKAGNEKANQSIKVEHPKQILVSGGGPAGMNAALSAWESGHTVKLYEKQKLLGGQLFLAAAPPGRSEFKLLARDLAHQISLTDIRVELGQEVNEEILEREKPDAVIIATGALPIDPPIPGANLPHVVQAWDILNGRASVGKKVVVVGGGAVGVETALFLTEKGTLSGDALKFLMVNEAEDPQFLYDLAIKGTKSVVLIEMLGALGRDIGMTTRWTMMQDLARTGVMTHVRTKALEITPKGVRVDQGEAKKEIRADTIVLAAGSKPHNPLETLLKERKTPYRVVGDAQKIGLAFDAVHEGFAAGKAV